MASSSSSGAVSPAEVIPEASWRLLGDKFYDKRRQAGIELEKGVRQALLSPDGGMGQIEVILSRLRRDYIESLSASHKKGGVLGLAFVAIALEEDVRKVLPKLVGPVLELFRDEDARVRYYACEALVNISKVAAGAILQHLNGIFDGVCKLYVDVDPDVRHGAQILDKTMSDLVKQWTPWFSPSDFAPLLAKHARNPSIRQCVLAWVMLLQSDVQVNVTPYLSQFLDGLFGMLGDQSRETRQNATGCLAALLKEVVASSHGRALEIISDTAGIVVKCCFSSDSCQRLTALCWLHQFVLMKASTSGFGKRVLDDKWADILPDLLGGMLYCVDDAEDEIAGKAIEMNNGLLQTCGDLDCEMPVDRLVDRLLSSMQARGSMVLRTVCLQWIWKLLERSKDTMLRRYTLDRLFDPMFEILRHTDDEVVVAALEALAQILKGRCPEQDNFAPASGSDLFSVVAGRLLELFRRERKMLEVRGCLLIRHLCRHLDARRLYITVAHAIEAETMDLDFAQQLVQMFNWILFTAAETKQLREELFETASLAECGKAAETGTPQSLFMQLLEPWFHNPVSALALCLWAQQYELASELTSRFAEYEPTLDLIRQLDQLVHLLESPVFSRLRLRFLEPSQHPALLECVLILAMLVPQAGAFSILLERLKVVQGGLLLEVAHHRGHQGRRRSAPVLSWALGGGGGSSQPCPSSGGGDLSCLLSRFDEMTQAARA